MNQKLNWACASEAPADEHYSLWLTVNTNEEKEREYETEKTQLPLTDVTDGFLFSCSLLLYFSMTLSWSHPWLYISSCISWRLAF